MAYERRRLWSRKARILCKLRWTKIVVAKLINPFYRDDCGTRCSFRNELYWLRREAWGSDQVIFLNFQTSVA